MYSRLASKYVAEMTLNFWLSCLCLLSAEVTDVCLHSGCAICIKEPCQLLGLEC